MCEEGNPELVAEQLRHTMDLLRSEIQALHAELAHYQELTDQRVAALDRASDDHEDRLRSVQDGVTSFKVWSGLANGGSSILALAALARAMGLG